jgi:hypothetical protein
MSRSSNSKEKLDQYLKWATWLIAGLAFVGWLMGACGQRSDVVLSERGIGLFIVCWGMLALVFCLRGLINGCLPSRSRFGTGYSVDRDTSPARFWFFIGVFSVAGIIAFVFGVIKLARYF